MSPLIVVIVVIVIIIVIGGLLWLLGWLWRRGFRGFRSALSWALLLVSASALLLADW